MFEIYISPSNQPLNVYAYGGTNEKAQMERLARHMVTQLSAYNCTPILATLSLHYSKRDEEAQAKGAKLYIAAHSDAGPPSAIGATAFSTPATAQLAEVIIQELNKICPYPENRADQTKDGVVAGFGEIWGPKAKGIPTILVETNFHTNPQVARWMIENIWDCAQAYTNAIVRHYGLVLKPIAVPTPTQTSTSFIVQINTPTLNFRSGPGIAFPIKGQVHAPVKFTIIEVKNGWGKLKSGAGWINLNYTKRL